MHVCRTVNILLSENQELKSRLLPFTIMDSGIIHLVGLMHSKLSENSHKSWEGMDLATLYDRAMVEMDELAQELAKPLTPKTRECIQRECADVANFLMKIAEIARKEEESLIANQP